MLHWQGGHYYFRSNPSTNKYIYQYIFSLAVYWTHRIPVHPSTKMIFINVESSQPTGRLPPPPYPQQSRKKLIAEEYFHHGWRKFWVLLLWNAPEWRISNDCWGILSPWLKKILSFTALKCSRMKDFHWLLGNTFTMVENFSEISFTLAEESFEFYCSEMLQNEGFSLIVREYFHHGWRNFWVLLL